MSKYLYTTVYEQFTGMKPPEPNSEEKKTQRRRGLGHPYRMRLQQDKPQETERPQRDEKRKGASRCRNPYRLRQFHQQNSGDNYFHKDQEVRKPQHQASKPRYPSDRLEAQPQQRPLDHWEHPAKAAPKVVYKKRRQIDAVNEQEAALA